MDTGLVKPAAGIVRTRFSTSRAETAPPELPSAQSVTGATGAPQGNPDRTRRERLARRAGGESLIDPRLREGAAPAEQANDAARKLRAYRRPEGQDEPDSQALEKTV